MLKALYDYAIAENLVAVPGFKMRRIDAYILLSGQGKFIDILPCPKGTKVLAPDLGSIANGTKKCNILISKALYVLNMGKGNDQIKSAFFKQALEESAEFEPTFRIVLDAINDEEMLKEMSQSLMAHGLKTESVIGFQVDGMPIEKCTGYHEWWQEFRKEQCDDSDGEKCICMITGNEGTPVATVPKVSGLIKVGGHTSGDALVCFDKAAFCSYGFKQTENASMAEESVTIVNAALENLIAKAPIHVNTKFVHWYKESLPVDPMSLFDLDLDLGEEDDEAETEVVETEEMTAEATDEAELKRLAKSIYDGELPSKPENRYYILPLTGAGGRVMVRGFDTGSCEELHAAIRAWFDDLSLTRIFGGQLRNPKLMRIYTRLIKYGNLKDAYKNVKDAYKNVKDAYKNVKKELCGLEMPIKNAAIKNLPLPDAMAGRALAYVRSAMFDDVNAEPIKHPDEVCCQILKAWLIRRGKPMKEKLYLDYPSDAYHMGRMFATYAAIQRASSPGVKVGIVERYFSAASTKPAAVLQKLADLSNHHLAKIDNPGLVIRYKKMLQEISCCIHLPFPQMLNTEQQSEFVLGYYQQCAEIFSKKSEEEKTEQQEEY